MRLALVGVPLMILALSSGSARAGDQAATDKVVQLNRQALDDFEAQRWALAKQKLLEALLLAKKAGLDTHPLVARTYVHLGVAYIAGFKNRDKAIQSFTRAFEIQPDIRLSRAIAATAEVTEAFDEAAGRPGRVVARPGGPGDGSAEPDLPLRVNALDCPVADQTLVDQAVPVRCALAPTLPVTTVFLLYRNPAKGPFTEVEMKKTPKGWFQARIPERVIYGASVQFYFEGRNAAGKPVIRNGNEQSPNLIVVYRR